MDQYGELIPNPFSSPKTIKSENTSVKQEPTASERPKQTHKTKRIIRNTKKLV